MVYPQSGSLIEPSINSGLSTQITVKVGPTTIGAIQQLTVNQNREIAVHEEIGTDGIVDSHPKNAAKIDLQVQRIVFDQLRLTEAFGRGFINIQAQRLPFDVEIIDRTDLSGDNASFSLVHVFHNCWFRTYSPTYSAENFIINEQATISVEYATSNRAAKSAVLGGKRGIPLEYDTIERETDVNGERGSFNQLGGENILGYIRRLSGF